ncbi:MAG: RlmE family RNA methyltransferase [Nanoarchaeota archaeon]|nr:RlmE family RNA methyltransferase [Nanoarchaeota archaeon]
MKKDKLTIKAKKEGYRARSVYKFFAINKKYALVRKNDKVLDLGCWPGSWIQALKKLDAVIVGVDITKIQEIPGTIFIQGDITSKQTQIGIKKYAPFDAVLSDLAPKTTGIREIDQQKCLDLSLTALEIAITCLRKNGNFLCKIFQNSDQEIIMQKARKKFHFTKLTKPQESKKHSKEMYLVCRGMK